VGLAGPFDVQRDIAEADLNLVTAASSPGQGSCGNQEKDLSEYSVSDNEAVENFHFM